MCHLWVLITGGEVQGLAKVMLDEVARHLHFTYHLQEAPPDEYWGELINGTWMGMAGQLVRGEKDLIIDGFAILLDRYHSLDLSFPYFTDSYSDALKVCVSCCCWCTDMGSSLFWLT